MSGIEVAGLVLGAIPIILAGLNFYAEGVRVTRRYWKYEQGVKDLLRQLGTELAIYGNSIKLLLNGVIRQKEIAFFLVEPSGKRWKDPVFETKLRLRLGTSFDSYLGTVNHLVDIAERFKDKLRLDKSGKPQFSNKAAFKEHYKRLKFSLNVSDYKELMAELRQTNESLHLLTTQTSSLSAHQATNGFEIRATPKFQQIKQEARAFHTALVSGWTCHCQASHSVGLCLDQRTETTSSDDEDEERGMCNPFHVFFRYEHQISSGPNVARPWTWDEASARIQYELQTAPSSDVHATVASKGVRFAKQAIPEAIKAALKVQSNLQPIQDLCSAIATLQKPQRDVCFSILAEEIEKQKKGVLLITPVKQPPIDTASWSVVSLRAILEDPSFAQQDRLKLAITLASSVLQLDETPWMDEHWGKDSVFFVRQPGTIRFDQPFVSRDMNKQISLTASINKRTNRVIRNQSLYALGVALIELYYRKPISDLRQDIDGPANTGDAFSDLMTEFNTADRLAEALLSEAGAKYSDAVRRCIRCDFDQHASSLEDRKFQRAVFQGVVAQLQENYEYLFQNYSD